MITNGPVQTIGFELGYTGKTKNDEYAICMQFSGRQIGEGSRLILIPVPGTITKLLNLDEHLAFLQEATSQTPPMGGYFPDNIDTGIRIPDLYYMSKIDTLVIHGGTSISQRLTSHWGSEVFLAPEYESILYHYFPGWDIVAIRFDNKSMKVSIPVGFTYTGPCIKKGATEHLYYPAFYNVSADNSNLFTGSAPLIGQADRKRLAVVMGLCEGTYSPSICNMTTVPIYTKEPPEEFSSTILSYVWDNKILLNGALLINVKTGAPSFSTKILAKDIRELDVIIV